MTKGDEIRGLVRANREQSRSGYPAGWELYIRPASSEACVGVGSVCAGARYPGENSEVPGENSGKQLTVI